MQRRRRWHTLNLYLSLTLSLSLSLLPLSPPRATIPRNVLPPTKATKKRAFPETKVETVFVAGRNRASCVHSTPLRSAPLRSTPLRSTPLHSAPLHSAPLHSLTAPQQLRGVRPNDGVAAGVGGGVHGSVPEDDHPRPLGAVLVGFREVRPAPPPPPPPTTTTAARFHRHHRSPPHENSKKSS